MNGSIVRSREVVPNALDTVTEKLMGKFFKTCRDYKGIQRWSQWEGCPSSNKDLQRRPACRASHSADPDKKRQPPILAIEVQCSGE